MVEDYKFEARNPNSETISNYQNSKTGIDRLSIIGKFGFRVCFEFRNSNFGFPSPLMAHP